jgi:hypothetical protein
MVVKITFNELASRITGVSTPVFGVSWNPPQSERDIVRHVIVFLEDRRALYASFVDEIEHEVSHSVLDIRDMLTNELQQLSEKSPAAFPLRAMRVACREYLDNTRKQYGPRFGFLVHLGRLRTVMGYHVAHLAINYGLDIEGNLISILPSEFIEDLNEQKEKPSRSSTRKKQTS